MNSMNSSLQGQNVSTAVIGQYYLESFNSALAKKVLVMVLGITINYINGTMIYTFQKHQVFYTNPRYILFIHLVINDMIQLLTSILLFVLSSFQINVFLCCIIISFAAFTTQNTPLNLAVMAVECYFAVCFPLQHSNLCSVKKICILIACIWTLSLLSILPDIFYIMAKNPAQLFLSTMCSIDKLITNLFFIQKKEVLFIVYFVGVWLVLFYTYFKIFSAAKSLKSGKSSDNKKARNTILLHSFQLLLCMLTYSYHAVLRRLVYLFPPHFIHIVFVWYIFVQVFPRCVSPILYGLRDAFFRNHLKKYLLCSIFLRYE